MKKNKVAIVGLGYVGLPLALLAERKGFEVVGIDIDKEKNEKINNKEAPFEDREIDRYIEDSRIIATDDIQKASDAEILIIAVPTPVDENNMPNLGPVKSAAKSISTILKNGQLVILESTVNPGVSQSVVLPILEETGLKGGKDFYLAHCPERVNPGDPKWHVENINRVVGALGKKGLGKAVSFYQKILEGNIKEMNSIMEAEACKVVENSFRDINIAFVNELAMSFSKLDIDVVNVIDGAATKPFAFMAHYPGAGVGGHCIPVDPYYLIEYARTKGFDHKFLSLARKINSQMPNFTAELVESIYDEEKIKNKKVAVLGLSYKANIDDDRESPSYEIIKSLEDRGFEVLYYDPHLPQKSNAKDLEGVLLSVEGVVLATAHKEFLSIKPEEFKEKNIKFIVDGRNALNKKEFIDLGIIYKGIGR